LPRIGDPIALRPIQSVPARADLITEELRRAILCGEISPGAALIERDIASALSVSKTPVREAIKTLVARGLVEVSPYRGATVRKVGPQMAAHVYNVRLLLEPEAARLAAERRPAGNLDDAERALKQAEAAAASRDFSRMALFNRDFHQALATASGNPVLSNVLAGLQDQTALVATQGWLRRATWKEEAAEHAGVLKAVRAGRSERASELMLRHIEGALARLTTEFSNETGGSSEGF
jgi:DNA-binding GntR family transcriptional regulator